MSRDLTANMITELLAATNRPIFLFEGEFGDGTLRYWSGTGPISWNGYTWEGNGLLHGIKPAAEVTHIEATGVEIYLAGVSDQVLSLILISAQLGRPGRIYFGFLDNSGAIVSSPYLLFEGRFDQAEIIESAENPMVTLKYESRVIDIERGKDWRYTPESQRIIYSGDKGFDYVSSLQDWKGFWGPKEKKPEKKDDRKGKPKNTNRRNR